MSAAIDVTVAAPVHPRDGRPAPRWAVRIAHLIPLLVLPSGVWRLCLALGLSMGLVENGTPVRMHGWVETAYVIGLSVVSEAVALLSLGLVRPWGERVPRGVPVLGGRRVPPLAAVAAATAGSVALILIWTFATVNFLTPGRNSLEFGSGWAGPLLMVCYLPLLSWGPLLLVITWAYRRRRCRD
ncbi:hypothetical protein ACNTMW_06695 [Planosporangium sp. 12N6]|uniref:hypothetical protein n=1 Tax=Planosporangium spinosum TaxID=3402278 RepID=UPI003CE8E252